MFTVLQSVSICLFVIVCCCSSNEAVKVSSIYESFAPTFTGRGPTIDCDGVGQMNTKIKYKLGDEVIYDSQKPEDRGKIRFFMHRIMLSLVILFH